MLTEAYLENEYFGLNLKQGEFLSWPLAWLGNLESVPWHLWGTQLFARLAQ